VEAQICELERGAATLTYSAGLSAMNAVFLEFLKAGDHLVKLETFSNFFPDLSIPRLQRHGIFYQQNVGEIRR